MTEPKTEQDYLNLIREAPNLDRLCWWNDIYRQAIYVDWYAGGSSEDYVRRDAEREAAFDGRWNELENETKSRSTPSAENGGVA